MQTRMNIARSNEIRKKAQKSGKIGLALGIWMAISINVVLKMVIRAVKFFLPPKILYRIKRNLFKPQSNETGVQS